MGVVVFCCFFLLFYFKEQVFKDVHNEIMK